MEIKKIKRIILGGGCFWKHQLNMQRQYGIINTEVGYSGGFIDHPCYKLVCTGQSNHAEVVLVEFNEEQISLTDVLLSFFNKHDPTQLNKQELDIGTQYRSCIFYYDDNDLPIIENVMKIIQQKYIGQIIHTEISKVKNYWKAEELHQHYLEKAGQNGQKGCDNEILCYN